MSCICSPSRISLMINMRAGGFVSCSHTASQGCCLPGASFALAVQDLLQLQIAPGFFYRALSHSEPDGWRRTGLVSPLLTHTCLLSSHLPTVVPHFQHHKSRIEIPEFGPRSKPHLQGIKTFVCIIRVGLAESGCSVLLTPNGAE